MKKPIILIIVFWVVVLLFYCCFNISGKQIAEFINWHIYLPSIKKNNVVFDDFSRNGDQISILTFKNSSAINKLIDWNKLNEVNSENIAKVKEKIDFFYNRLGENGKASFDDNIDFSSLLDLSRNYYYLFKIDNDNESFIILLLDIENSQLYDFISIR